MFLGVVKNINNHSNNPVVYNNRPVQREKRYDLLVGFSSYFNKDWYYVGSADNIGKFETIIDEIEGSKDDWKVIDTHTNEECKHELFY